MLQLGAPGLYTHGGRQRGPAVNSAPHVSESEQSTSFDRQELTVGEVTGDEVSTNMFPILFRTYRYLSLLGGSPELARPRAWWLGGGALAIPSDGMARRAWLRHLQTLAKLYGVD